MRTNLKYPLLALISLLCGGCGTSSNSERVSVNIKMGELIHIETENYVLRIEDERNNSPSSQDIPITPDVDMSPSSPRENKGEQRDTNTILPSDGIDISSPHISPQFREKYEKYYQ